MEVSEFVSPLEAVHVLSIFSYLNTLSDILYVENFLNEQDQHKPIPIVNSLYNYLQQDNVGKFGIQNRKIHLARKLINGTDLYGAKQNETMDPYFIDALFYHIVDNLVFSRFTNVFGFIVEIIRTKTDSDSLSTLHHSIKETLSNLKYENEYGDDSQITPIALASILTDLIEPLFPRSKNPEVRVTSLDYIYAMAGKMFLKFDKTDTIDDPLFMAVNTTRDDERQYQEYIEIAHTVEQMVLAQKVNESALKIFALPALVNYIYKEKANLESQTPEEILTSPYHWQKAYRNLFTYLNTAFLLMSDKEKNDHRYQYQLALSNYKNRTTLARDQLEMNCQTMNETEIEQEIIRYKNNPKDYKCKFSENGDSLEDINTLFEDMIDDISDKYYLYEKEYCRKAFGHLPKSMTPNVVVSKGLIQYYYFGQVGIQADSVQLVNEKHDLLQFYYPDSGQYVYYALVRNGYNISLIKETDNPKLFRKTLGLNEYETFRSNNFPEVLKTQQEDFDNLLVKIADKRMKNFRKVLQSEGYDETRKEWWTNFALSLIPFYTCVQDFKEENLAEAEFVCPLDAVFLIPVAKELGFVIAKVGKIAEKSILSVTETTLRTVMLRTSMRTLLRITSKTLIDEFAHYGELFTRETVKDLGLSIARFIDPGFELAFTIGQTGLRSIKSFVLQAERKFATASKLVKSKLLRAQYTLSHFSQNINKKFGKDVYLTTVYSNDVGYGYKYIPLNEEITEIRTIYPSKKEFPLVAKFSPTKGKIYHKINLQDEKIIDNEYFNEEEGIVTEEQYFELNIINTEGDQSVEGGKMVTNLMQKLKPQQKFIQETLDTVIKKGKIPEEQIKTELKKYNFPRNEPMEVNFVREWMNNPELKTPMWAEKYKLQEPELFFQLKYKETMDSPFLDIETAKRKIKLLYPLQQHMDIIKELPVEKLLRDFLEKEAYKSVRFEDYYALRWYGGSGYKKMGETSLEASRMKNAIYRLAIRQSEEPSEQYAVKLFRGERRITEAIEKEISSLTGDFQFTRFTSTSSEINTAITYSYKGNPTQTRVTYVMNFRKPIVRARVEDLFVLNEKETILLPGTKFHIEKIERYVDDMESGAKENCIRIEMTNVDEPMEVRQKNIMQEINKLRKKNIVFYPEDISE